MQIMINGKLFTTTANTLATLLEECEATLPYSVAVNGEFVAKDHYASVVISANDTVDIVSPIFGG